MNYLFYLVHPAKFHFHRVSINRLLERGHKVDILINTKDVLEELVIEEGWNYKNIFPKGRKINSFPPYISALFILPLNYYRLWSYIIGKTYDLFIGPQLCAIGKITGTPTLYVTDDDIHTTPNQIPNFEMADYVLAPKLCDIGAYNYKRIHYDSQKALAHLHPNYFRINTNNIPTRLRNSKGYFMIRLSKYNSIHDSESRNGIDDKALEIIVSKLIEEGDIFISSERRIPENFEKYLIDIEKKSISDILSQSSLLVSDSTTMIAEAATLGIPSIEYDDWWEEIELIKEIQVKYKLSKGVKTGDYVSLTKILEEFIQNMNQMKKTIRERHERFLSDCIDISSFQFWLLSNFPDSAELALRDPAYQYNFNF